MRTCSTWLILLLLSLQALLKPAPAAAAPITISPYFARLSTEQGLPSDAVWSIAQDRRGFLWLATFAGLSRYDGYRFRTFEHDPANPASLSSGVLRTLFVDRGGTLWVGSWQDGLNRFDPAGETFTRYLADPDDPASIAGNAVRAIIQDRAGRLWFGTNGGLSLFDPASETFRSYRHDPDDPASLSHDDVFALHEDRAGAIWVGTYGGGLNRFDPAGETFTHYRHDPDDPSSLSSDLVYTGIMEDQAGMIWVGTWQGGLSRLDPASGRFRRYQHNPADPASLSDNTVTRIHTDRHGRIWVGTYRGGLNLFDPASETFTRYQYDPLDPTSLSGNDVVSLFEDAGGLLWVGTQTRGLSRLDLEARPFAFYRHQVGDPASLSPYPVRGVYEDRRGQIWVGTLGGGLDVIDPATRAVAHHQHSPDDPHSLSSNRITAVYGDRAGLIWVGTEEHGLNRFDPATGQVTHYRHDPDDPTSLGGDRVLVIAQDRAGMIWVGTAEGGLSRLDPAGGRFTRYARDPDDPASLSYAGVSALYEDRAGMLWVGTPGGGLSRLDPASGRFTHYRHDPDDPASLSHNAVSALIEDAAGAIWVSTWGGGLNRLDVASGRFTRYHKSDGLVSDTLYGLLLDGAGDLWISAPTGLTRMSPHAGRMRSYDRGDGLPLTRFSFYAYHRGASGRFYFGGDGLIGFDPLAIHDSPVIPPVALTDFQLANRPVAIGGPALPAAIGEASALTLPYDERVISFEFAALDYRAPQKQRYRYRLLGFEREWNEVGSERRFVTYTNLRPGSYTFQVLGSNNDGLWNETGCSLTLTITPPWWEATWFRLLALSAAAALAVGSYRWRVGAIRRYTRRLEDQVAERTRALALFNQQLQQEVAERKRAEEELVVSLREKELLLKEIHHRVKNNLQIVSSLFRLQSATLTDQQSLELLRESQNRVRSMALVHDRLYQSADLSRISFQNYAEELTTLLVRSYRANPGLLRRAVLADGPGGAADVTLTVDQAIPCGLILNELISNALKHAWPDERPGTLLIQMHLDEGGVYTLTVRDDGVGMPRELDPHQARSMGLRLVTSLTRQLNGRLELLREQGSEWRIRFGAA